MSKKLLTKAMLILGIAVVGQIMKSKVVHAQGTQADYDRAERLESHLRKGILNVPSQLSWQDQDRFLTYVTEREGGREFVVVDLRNKIKRPAFDHVRLAAAMATAIGQEVDAKSLPFAAITLLEEGRKVGFEAFEKHWIFTLDTYELKDIGPVKKNENRSYWGSRQLLRQAEPISSPDSLWEAFIKNSNVYLRKRSAPFQEIQLSYDGSEGEYYRPNLQWSPDSKHLIGLKVRPASVRILTLLESSPLDQLQPKLQTRDYVKPGDALDQYQPVLFSTLGHEQIFVPWELIPDQFAISDVKWREDSRAFTFEYNQRGHQEYSVFEMDARTGSVKKLIQERSPTFIDYSGKKYRYDVKDGQEIIWASERDGWNHLYLIDGKTGQMKNQITKGDWVVRNVVKVDENNRELILEVSGIDKNIDPYFIQYYCVKFDGSNLKPLTEEPANHKAVFLQMETFLWILIPV